MSLERKNALPINEQRRQLLKVGATMAVGAGVAGPMLAGCSPNVEPGVWRNWSGSETSRPSAWLTPRNEPELIRQLQKSQGAIRVTGASHSFTPLCKTADTLISIGQLSGIISHDNEQQQATVWAGTRLSDLGEPLWELGQGLVNQGDIDVQSVAGACGTSTHGTGRQLGSFSAQVRGVRVITPTGEAIEANATQDADVWKAASTSLGALGVISQVTLQNRPRYRLRQHEFLLPVQALLPKLNAFAAENDHAEFFIFYESDLAIVKLLNDTDEPDTPEPWFTLPESAALDVTSRIAHGLAGMDGPMQRLLTLLHSEVKRVGRSYRIYPSARESRFNEMEYEVPVERGPDCLAEILATVRRSGIRTLFPVEYRFVAADDVWLSPFFGRASASISIHQHISTDHRPLFKLVEPIFWKYGGRPHWGKIHSLTAAQLAELYPHWDDYQRIRRRLDPHNRMLNDYLRRVLVNA